MRTKLNTALIICICILFSPIYSQQYVVFGNEQPNEELAMPKGNDGEHPCISETEYQLIEQRVAENIQLLGLSNVERSTQSTGLDWPLQPAAGLTDCSYYHIAAYVDQNTTAGVFQDFNCGTNSYDGHRGTDISTWPFNFYKMDNSLVEVIAAAPGIIIDKHDGEFDRNCSSNNLTANYVVIQHADGSVALYWHMKSGAVTNVAIGQPVVTGQYLGIVGSSGSASGPHLHFEVWAGSTAATRVDPYGGGCNTLNATSWWNAQKPAMETSVVKVSVNTTDIVMPPCPTTETPNESSAYVIPFQGPGLSAGYAKFYIFIRDEVNGLNADVKILNPDNSTYLSWTYNSTSNNKTRYWGWSKLLPTIPGTYTFQATYNGTTCSTSFDIIAANANIEQNNIIPTKVYPNPSSGKFIIETDGFLNTKLEVYTLLGENIYNGIITNLKTEIDLMGSKGIYFYKISSLNKVVSSGKLIVQ